MTCEMTVAHADPLIPQPKPKIKSGFSMQLITTEDNVAYMANFGKPEERSTAFSPKYMWVTTFPIRITFI